MNCDAVSEINLWCQKNHQPLPQYMFFGMGTEWYCHLTAQWLGSEGKRVSQMAVSKKLAKQDVATQVFMELRELNNQTIELKFPYEYMIIMIDGDQRMDCWKWLAAERVYWNGEKVKIMSFISPTTQEIVCSRNAEYAGGDSAFSDKEIEVIKAKTTNKDSADALMLMTLGKILHQGFENTRILIVSSDHILVQAAQDSEGVDWVANLKQLQEYFQVN